MPQGRLGENKERSFKDLENNIADNDQWKALEGAKQQEHVNAQHKTRAKKGTKEVFMESRESRSLFVSWALELSDRSFNCLLLTLWGRVPPPCKNFSCRMLVSLTLQDRVPLPPRGTLFSRKQALS